MADHDSPPAADPAAVLAMLDVERARAARALGPDPRLIYGIWGAAWLLGFLAFWTSDGRGPVALSFSQAAVLYWALLLTAIAVTVVHTARRTAGVRGVTARVGVMFGWIWFAAFMCLTATMNGITLRGGLPSEVLALLWVVLSALIVGTLYMAAGALWRDRVQYALGAWILVAGGAGGLAGFPAVYLVMAFAGGGGFLVAATICVVRDLVRRPRVTA